MTSREYMTGFIEKLAEYEKSAKFSFEMTKDEKEKADKARAATNKRLYGTNGVRVIRNPRTLMEHINRARYNFTRGLGALGHGIASTAGVTAVRAGENIVDMSLWIPALADKLLFGKMLGVDHGRGLFGRTLGGFHRGADRMVHGIRDWSDSYARRHGINNNITRFMNGAVADAAGTFIGFGGLRGLASKGINKALGVGFGGLGAVGSLTDGQQRQLREREDMIRGISPSMQRYIDPTSTKTNIEEAPTKYEYQNAHLPGNMPTSITGKFKVPYNWAHDRNGMPLNFGGNE